MTQWVFSKEVEMLFTIYEASIHSGLAIINMNVLDSVQKKQYRIMTR